MGTVQGSKVRLEQLRPRAKSKLSFLKLDLKHEVLVNNHNIEKLEERLLVLRRGDGLEKYILAPGRSWRSPSPSGVREAGILRLRSAMWSPVKVSTVETSALPAQVGQPGVAARGGSQKSEHRPGWRLQRG